MAVRGCQGCKITARYLGSSSIPQQTRSVSSAAANVVPLPRNGSYTNSPRFVWFRIGRRIRSTGFWVGWSYFSWFRCELRSRHPDRVEFHADRLAQSVQRAPAPGRSDRFVRALVSPVSALLRARRRTGARTWCGDGCQLHLALGPGLCTRTEQTLPTASQTDEQELSDRRDLHKT